MSLHQVLVELYLSLKAKSNTEVHPLKLEGEKLSLMKTDSFAIIKYISSYIDIFVNSQVEKALKIAEEQKQDESSQGLEQLTQSLEAEARLHIRVIFIIC